MPAAQKIHNASASPLNAEELATWNALKHLSERAFRLVGQAIETATGLSAADYGILSRLDDSSHGLLQQHELMKSLGWHKARLSQQLTRMEARLLVSREARTPREGVTVKILPSGREAILAGRPVHAASIRRHILNHLRPDEARLIVEIVKRLDE